MRDDAARALRVEDDLPWWAGLPDIGDRPTPRRFERTGTVAVARAGAVALRERPAPAEPRRGAPEREREPERPAPARNAPGRAYGSHRRADAAISSSAAFGYQPGRRTVEIRGQVHQPRRRSQTTSAFIASPDRAALWAFLLAIFMIVMALATAHG